MREGVWQCRDAAKPRGADNRWHVVRHDAQIVVVVGWDRGAIAHLEHGRRVRNGAGEQQRQRWCAVRRIARGKFITGDAAVGIQPAIDVHQLRGALGLPRVLLFARELHTNGAAHRARQKNRVGGNVIGAVAPVAAGRFQPDHLDLRFAPVDQPRQFGAQMMRVLRARPDPGVIVLVVSDRAGRADRGVHLVGPDISPLHRFGCIGNRGGDVALVDQRSWRGRIGTQRRLYVLQVGQRRHRLPGDFQLRRGLDRIFLAFGDDTDEVADADNRDEPGDVAHRSLIDRDQAGADEIAGVDAGIGRTDNAAVQHARYAQVVNVDQLAGCLRRQIDARDGLPDDGVGAGGLDRNVVGEFKPDGFARYQFAIADAAIVPSADQAVFDGELFNRNLQPLRGARGQKLSRLRCRLAQRYGGDLDRLAGNRRALIGHQRRIAQHDDDSRKGHVEFLGDDLAECGADAGAEIDMPVIGGDRSVGGDPDEGFELDGLDGRGWTKDGQRSLRPFTIPIRVRYSHQACASTMWPAARIAARLISICAPHRHR